MKINRMIRRGICLPIYLLLFIQVIAQDIPIDASLKQGRLSNGFTYLIRENKNASNKIVIRLIVKTGTLFQDADQLEIAHFVEHMAFNGTKHFPGNRVREYFASVGIRLGTDMNANTGTRSTSYRFTIPANKKDILDTTLFIIRDIAQNMELLPGEIDAERGVLLGEIGRASDPFGKLLSQWQSDLIRHKGFASSQEKRIQNIKTFSYETAIRFYKDWYRPDLQGIIVVGDIDAVDLEKKISNVFNSLKVQDSPRIVPNLDSQSMPVFRRDKPLFVYSNPDLRDATVYIYKWQPAKQERSVVNNTTDIRTFLIDEIYNEMMMQRLKTVANKNEHLYKRVGVNISRSTNSLPVDALYEYFSLKHDQSIQAAVIAIELELNRTVRDGFLPAEFKEAKDFVDRSIVEKYTTQQQSFWMADNLERYFVYGGSFQSPEQERELYKKILQGIKINELNDAAKYWNNTDKNINTVILHPDSVKVNRLNNRTITKWLSEGKKKQLPAYVLPAKINNLLEGIKIPVGPAGTFKITENTSLDTREVVFGDGLRLYLKPITTSEQVSLLAYKAGGTLSYPAKQFRSAVNANYINYLGAGKYDNELLGDFANNKNISLSLNINDTQADVFGRCDSSNIETLLQLLLLKMVYPRKDEQLYEQVLARKKYEDRQIRNARSIYIDSINKYKPAYTQKLTSQSFPGNAIDKDFDEAWLIYQQVFSNPAQFTYVLSGNFNLDSVIALFNKYFGNFPNPSNVAVVSPPALNIVGGAVRKQFFMGDNSYANIEFNLQGKCQYDLRNDVLFKLVEKALTARLKDRLREKEGGTYEVVVKGSFYRMQNIYTISFGFTCAPANYTRMTIAAFEELQQLKLNGIDDNLLKQLKEQIVYEYRQKLNSPELWSVYLHDQLAGGQSIEDILKTQGILDILPLATVNQYFDDIICLENLKQFALFPAKARSNIEP